jgi:hypothetical protein
MQAFPCDPLFCAAGSSKKRVGLAVLQVFYRNLSKEDRLSLLSPVEAKDIVAEVWDPVLFFQCLLF